MAKHIRQKQPYKWRRLWIAPDDGDGVAARGLFSAEMHAMVLKVDRPEARSLRDMEDVRVLLLRGESGAGKTVTLAEEAKRLRAAGKPVEFADLSAGLYDLAALFAEKGTQEEVTIFVDGLDVALIRDGALDTSLRRAAAKLAGGPCARLRIALRAGFAAGHLVDFFTEHFGDGFEHLTLAPLRSEDVMTAARDEDIDPVEFLFAIEGLRVAPLAARPPTLKMLLRLWALNGHLPKRRHELYRQGCEVLLRETNSTRLNAGGGFDPHYVGRLEPPERFAIAARLAALMTFGDYDYLNLGEEPDGLALHVDAIAGSAETTIGGTTRITRAAVREVAGSALFRPAGADGFAFSHPTFMRFLAAAFVSNRGFSLKQGLSLLTAAEGCIGANRIDVASWLGALEHPYFEHLTAVDPQVLLRAGIPAATDEQRLQLAKSLLAISADSSLDMRELSETGDLVLVASQGLEELLAGILSDKKEPQARRMFAAQIARDAACAPVAACAALALDESEPSDLRFAALTALEHKAEAAETAIRTLCEVDAPNEELRLTALALGMRSFLSPADVIRRLKPTSDQTAQSALCLYLLNRITVETLPETLEVMLEIAVRSSARRPYWDHRMVAQDLARRAFVHLDDAFVHEALANFIAKLPPREPWLRWSYPLQKYGLPEQATYECRRSLVLAIVAQATDATTAARNLLESCFLLHSEDLPWIVEEARSSLGGPHAAIWSTLVVEVVLGFGGVPYQHLRLLGATDLEINELAQASIDLPNDYERWIPPPSWDHSTRTFTDRVQEEEGQDNNEEEPLFRALADWKLLTIQKDAGGRPNAPSVSPSTLLALAENADRRLVCDSGDLLRVVRESLGRLQRRLKGRDALVRALWNEGETSRPKDENFLSDFIVDHLRLDLVGRGIVADREVQIRARIRDTAGQRTDIQVQAFTGPRSAAANQRIASLTIEVKCSWNPRLNDAMQTQLVERYLASTGEDIGLYLVGWYAHSEPEKVKSISPPPTDVGLARLQDRLNAQARSLSTNDRYIEAAVIDVTLK